MRGPNCNRGHNCNATIARPAFQCSPPLTCDFFCFKKMAAQQDGFINFSLDYIIKTWVGKLKVGELVFTLLAGACGSSVISYDNSCSCAPKFGFFDFVAWTAFINALINMIIHLLGLWNDFFGFFDTLRFIQCCVFWQSLDFLSAQV